jgi:hypothetical protein
MLDLSILIPSTTGQIFLNIRLETEASLDETKFYAPLIKCVNSKATSPRHIA